MVFTGAGISAPSGLKTFRDGDGLWHNHRIEDVATPEAWERNPELVLNFYNERRTQAAAAQPNPAHLAIARLESRFEVVVITQNVDDLHERAGSTRVIHLHGELRKARSTYDRSLIYDIGSSPIHLGDHCEKGSQLRPHIVWFGENILCHDEAISQVEDAGKLLVVGTSLSVYPAAGLIDWVHPEAEKILINLKIDYTPEGFRIFEGSADTILPKLCEEWMEK